MGKYKRKKYLSKNYKNISINKRFLSSNNKKYLSKFIILQKEFPDVIEIHNRPNYVQKSDKLKSKIIIYFHNNPLKYIRF